MNTRGGSFVPDTVRVTTAVAGVSVDAVTSVRALVGSEAVSLGEKDLLRHRLTAARAICFKSIAYGFKFNDRKKERLRLQIYNIKMPLSSPPPAAAEG